MKALLYGISASLGLLSLYAVSMTLLSGWEAAIEQFAALWFLMIPLVAGFGIQVGLYTTLRSAIKQQSKLAMVSGGTSAGISMLACCAHHATDLLPIIGLSGLATMLGQYQKPILFVSLIINILGIRLMWQHVRKVV